jgi:iron complex transport system substrate-binding protein
MQARRAIESSRLFASLPAVRRGAYAVIDLDTAIAMRTPSALSIPYALDRMVPTSRRRWRADRS